MADRQEMSARTPAANNTLQEMSAGMPEDVRRGLEKMFPELKEKEAQAKAGATLPAAATIHVPGEEVEMVEVEVEVEAVETGTSRKLQSRNVGEYQGKGWFLEKGSSKGRWIVELDKDGCWVLIHVLSGQT